MRRPPLQMALAVSLVFAGCSMLGSDPVRQPTAVDRLDAAQERVDSVSTYRYDVTVDVSTTASDERVTGHGVGAVNTTTRRQVVNLSVDGTRSVSYLDNRTAFTECRGSVAGGFWGRQNRSGEENWTALTPIGRQLELLSTGDLYHDGTETIDGREVVHISGRPTDAEGAGARLDERRQRRGRPLARRRNEPTGSGSRFPTTSERTPSRTAVPVAESGAVLLRRPIQSRTWTDSRRVISVARRSTRR